MCGSSKETPFKQKYNLLLLLGQKQASANEEAVGEELSRASRILHTHDKESQ
jgi:hypothetical protein